TGVIESDGQFARIPQREIRPRPRYSFKGRTYVGALSPEGMPIMAQLGVGLLVIPQKPWPSVRQDLDSYKAAWVAAPGGDFPLRAPSCGGHTFVSPDGDHAREMAHRYVAAYYESVIKHYAFDAYAHAGVKGYEFYAGISRQIEKRGARDAAA